MHPDPFEYDVALSFAREDRAIAGDLARMLADRNIKVFLDEFRSDDRWGKNVVDHLVNLYDRKARYCLLFVSSHYPLDSWTVEERESATERALRDADEYILVLRLDDIDIPGIGNAAGAFDLHQHSMESVADLLEQKLKKIRLDPGPPSQSHDLRSGNVPSTDRQEDAG